MSELVIPCGQRSGTVHAPGSKSYIHRLLFCGALGKRPVAVKCGDVSDDIAATVGCLNALCADITADGDSLYVRPRDKGCTVRTLNCGESGTTLRFLLPVCGALGVDAELNMEGRLPERPIGPLISVLREHGMTIDRRGGSLVCGGKLRSGCFEITGNVSSQFISALLLALPLLDGDSRIVISGSAVSSGYIAMTGDALKMAGIVFEKSDNVYNIPGGQQYCLPDCAAEGDYSNAAFFLCMGALSDKGVTVTGLSEKTLQGDSVITDILRKAGASVTFGENSVTVRRERLSGFELDASHVPDLVPALAVLGAAASGRTEITNAGRLRQKESDRLKATAELIASLGGAVTELPDGLIIDGGGLRGGRVRSYGDHRIAMAAAVAACACTEPVTVDGPDCVKKSYPRFRKDLNQLEL